MNARGMRRALQLKQLLERVRVAELADAERQLDDATRRLSISEVEQGRTIAALCAQTEVSVLELAERARFVASAAQAVLRERAAREEELSRRESKQAEAHEATRGVRTLERLHERNRLEERQRLQQAEQQLLDEHGQRKREDR